MPRYKFEEIAINSTAKKKPSEADKNTYLGLEHLDSGNLTITSFGSEVAPIGEKLLMKKGDVLFGKRRAYQKKVAIAPFDGIFSAHGMVLRPRTEVVTKEFFPLFIASDYFLDAAIKISVGSLSPTINWSALKELEFNLPVIDEQRSLAEVLWAMIEAKNAYTRLIKHTDLLVKCQFVEMFGDPVTNSKRLPTTEFVNVMKMQRGFDLPVQQRDSNGTVPLFASNGIIDRHSEARVFGGGIITGRSGTIGKIYYTFDDYWPLNTTLFSLELNGNNIIYLAYLLEYFDLARFATGSGVPTLNRNTFHTEQIINVPLDLQNRFADFVRQSDKSKFIVLDILEMAKMYIKMSLKQGLQQEDVAMFNESELEKMVVETISANGWEYITSDDLPRRHSDVMVEPFVREALIRLNPEIAAEPSRADEVIYKLRTLILSVQPHDLVAQNERFKRQIFESNSFPFGKDGRMIPIRFFGTGSKEDLALNHYVVTDQWVYPKEEGGKRLDVVLLINGFPVAVGEMKTPTRSAVTWLDGAGDISAYEKSIPQMFVTNVFNFATEGKCFRYGSVNMPINLWGPWHTPDDKAEGALADVKRSIADMFKPETVMDIFQFFTLFATDKKYRKFKIISRYQQFEGANLIVERVKAGYPKKGLIWHFQGSGKSLLMVFAAQKLRMAPELKNPTVVIVDDRIDLETQITATFNASDIPNLQSASSKEELMAFFKGDMRKILITTIFKFGEVDGVLNPRDNIILMVDEAHRTQEGDLGERMRMALPNAFFFGLTGTPINRRDKNTFYTFGATEDRSGYMSRYSFSDSIRDNATLPLYFEPVPVDLHVFKDNVTEKFDEMADDMGLTLAEKSDVVYRVNIEAIMKSPERIRRVCEHIAEHYREKIEPNGFKGQVVCYDRECCLLYKKTLDTLLGEYASTIVMDTNNDKEGKYKDFRRDRDEEGRLLDRFRDAADPLKLVVVTSKLLTGFDAPVLQAMYLDKPMKDHTLLQAICRTNRVYGQEKSHGLIVDYVGIFDDVARALNFDEKNIQQVITNITEVKKQFPALIEKCLSYFNGVDRTVEGWEGLVAAQECLPTAKEKDEFGADYRVLNRAYEALSPDAFLAPYRFDYRWLTKVYESVRPSDGRGGLIWAALGAKTIELVHQNITVEAVRDDMDILKLDADLIDQFIEHNKNNTKNIKKIEIDLVAKIQKHSKEEKFIKLGERLEDLREKHEQGLISSIEFLKLLLELAKEAAQAEKEVVPEEEIDKGKAALTELFNSVKNDATPIIVERIVTDIDAIVKIVRFDGWQNTTEGKREVTKALRSVVWIKYKIKDEDVFDKAYRYIEMYY